MMLDEPWKIAVLVSVLVLLRIAWGTWRTALRRRHVIEFLDSGLIAVILVFVIIRPFVVQAFHIPSASMETTLMTGDRLLVNRFIYRLNPPQRGDIVVFRAPPAAVRNGEQKDFVKRLIGLPGDTIYVKRGEGVYINGQRLQEPVTIQPASRDWSEDGSGALADKPYRVPDDCYFVLGDNRNNSRDSRVWRDRDGSPHPEVEADALLGKALVVFWPPGRIALVGDHHDVRLTD
jgi:signal peptidase I